MELDDLIVTWFCLIDDGLQAILHGQRLRQRGTDATLSDDAWHLADRLLRKVLVHTLAVFTNLALHRPPLHLADLVA